MTGLMDEQALMNRLLNLALAAWKVSDLTETILRPSPSEMQKAELALIDATLEVTADDLDLLAKMCGRPPIDRSGR